MGGGGSHRDRKIEREGGREREEESERKIGRQRKTHLKREREERQVRAARL